LSVGRLWLSFTSLFGLVQFVYPPAVEAKARPAFVIDLPEAAVDTYPAVVAFRGNGNLFVGILIRSAEQDLGSWIIEFDGETGAEVRRKQVGTIPSKAKRVSVGIHSQEGRMLHYLEARRSAKTIRKTFDATTLEELSSRRGLPYEDENPYLDGYSMDGQLHFLSDTEDTDGAWVAHAFGFDPRALDRMTFDATEKMPAEPPRWFYLSRTGEIWWTTDKMDHIARFDLKTKRIIPPEIPIARGIDLDNVVFLPNGFITLTDESRRAGKHRGRAYRFAKTDGRELARRDFSDCAFLDDSYVGVSSDASVVVPPCVKYKRGDEEIFRHVDMPAEIRVGYPDRGVPVVVRLVVLDTQTLEPLLQVSKKLKKHRFLEHVVWHGNGEVRLAWVDPVKLNRVEVYRVPESK